MAMGARRRRSDARVVAARSGCGRADGIRGDVRPRQCGRPARLVRGGDVVRPSDAVRRQLDCHARSHGASPGGRGEPRGRITRQSDPGRHRLAGAARQRGSALRGDCQSARAIPSKLLSMGAAGRALVEKDFSWRAATDRLLARLRRAARRTEIRCRLQACFERCASLSGPAFRR